jgi:apolipoprotein N-acyltransferase
MRQLLLALVAGLLSVLAYAPFEFWWLSPLLLGTLFYLWLKATPARCFWIGFSFGFGIFIAGVSWVYLSLQVYGQMPVPLAMVAVVGFVAFLSLFPALAGYVQARMTVPGRIRLMLAMPVSWVVFEWMRGWVLTGFPWLHVGYTQAALPLSGYAPAGGIYLVSLAVALVAAGLTLAVTDKAARGAGLVGILVIFSVGWGLSSLSWVEPDGEPLNVAAVQGNIPLDTKWQATSRDDAIQRHLAWSPQDDIDLIVWPEAAVSYYIDDIPEMLWSHLEDRQGDYVFGTIEALSVDGDIEFYNSAVIMCGNGRQVYRKRHLVPFGEYLPLAPVFGWILEYLHIPMSDFSSSEQPRQGYCAGGSRVSVSICYEDAFGDEMRRAVGDSNLLLNVSEDAWFGNSLAPHQRLQMARMRVIETGRPMVRASNTGPSAILDHRGNILASTRQFEPAVARGRIQPMRGSTPYTRFGDAPVITVLIFFVFLLWIRQRVRPRE